MSDDLIARLNRAADWLIEHHATASAITMQDARDEITRLRKLIEAKDRALREISELRNAPYYVKEFAQAALDRE